MLSREFVGDLERVINKHSVDNLLSTPDFILAAYLANVLVAKLNAQREVQRWSGMAVPDNLVLQRAEDPEYRDVEKFHEKFGQLVGLAPRFLAVRKAEERGRFLQEELDEYLEGVRDGDLAKQADSLIDLVYVAKGTAVMQGLPWRELWDDVHAANMRKVPGTTHRGNLVDVCKPEGWVGPKTFEILLAHGFADTAYCCAGADDEVHLAAAALTVDPGPSDPPPTTENPIGGAER